MLIFTKKKEEEDIRIFFEVMKITAFTQKNTL